MENIQHVATNASQVAVQSSQAVDKAKEGNKAAGNVITQIGNIEITANASATVVAKLGERSKEIGQIVDGISQVLLVRQTYWPSMLP